MLVQLQQVCFSPMVLIPPSLSLSYSDSFIAFVNWNLELHPL